MRVMMSCVAIAALMTAAPAAAQDDSSNVEAAFVGAFAGLEAGAIEHYVVVEVTAPNLPALSSRFGKWDVGGGLFAGYDIALGRRVRLGGEIEATVGGGAPAAQVAGVIPYSEDPRWGYRVAGRLGYVVDPRTMGYVTAGYGAQRYRVVDPFDIGDGDWRGTIALGGGIEHRLSARFGVRADYRVIPGVSHQIMIGVPIRF